MNREFFEAEYRTKTTDELVSLESGDLIDAARQALATVLQERGIEGSVKEQLAAEIRADNVVAPELRDLASLEKRFLGQVIDFAVAVAISLPLTLLGTPVTENAGLIALLLAFVYVLLADALPGGRSLGKRVVKTSVRVVATGKACRLGRSFVRNAPLMLLGFLDWVFILGRKRQRLGDILAGTRVIDTSLPSSRPN